MANKAEQGQGVGMIYTVTSYANREDDRVEFTKWPKAAVALRKAGPGWFMQGSNGKVWLWEDVRMYGTPVATQKSLRVLEVRS